MQHFSPRSFGQGREHRAKHMKGPELVATGFQRHWKTLPPPPHIGGERNIFGIAFRHSGFLRTGCEEALQAIHRAGPNPISI